MRNREGGGKVAIRGRLMRKRGVRNLRKTAENEKEGKRRRGKRETQREEEEGV
jgi:hypothetical protein